MISKTVNDWIDLRREFIAYGRQGQFTEDGYEALFDLLHEMGECSAAYDFERLTYAEWQARSGGVKLDVIGLCCEYYEDDAESVLAEYDDCDTIEDLQDRTWAVELDNGNIILQSF